MVICLKREIWGEENYSKNICKDKIMEGGLFYLNLLLEGKFTQAPHAFQGKQIFYCGLFVGT